MGKPVEENTSKDLLKSSSAISHSVSPQKEEIMESNEAGENLSSPTPVKTKEPSRVKSKDEPTELPEKHATLLEFFERMISSLRLLGLRKKTPTFQNVSSQVEILTGRKFLLNHLAQIKYILPEAVQIEKILIHDEKTKLMKSDVKIALLFDIVKDHHEESVFVALSNILSSRLRDFIIEHPEACDVPEAALPEPFSQGSITHNVDLISKDLPTFSGTGILISSHLGPSFRKHFYQNGATAEMEKTDILSPVKSTCEVNGVVETLRSPPGSSSRASMSQSTPMKPVTGSDIVLVDTPVQSTPIIPISVSRLVLTCEDENKMTASQKGKQPTSSAKKSLDFCKVDGEDTIFSHRQISISLSDLVLLIHEIFLSVKFCPITKEELVQKIIMNKLEFDDCTEVEMQMENLEKLVPDWFFKKMAPSGDLLYNLNKVFDPNTIRERINAI